MTTLSAVLAHLADLRRGLRTWAVVTGVAATFAALLWVTVLFVLVDLQFQLGGGGRGLGFVGLIAGVAVCGWLTTKALLRRLSPENLSRRIENVRPELRNRLINVVQFGAAGVAGDAGQAAFAERLLVEAPLPLAGIRPAHLFPVRLAKNAAWIALAAAVIVGLMAVIAPRGTLTSLQRLLLPLADIPPYTLTRLVALEPGATSVARGQGITVTATFGGVIPTSATLVLTSRHQEDRLIPMSVDADHPAVFIGVTPALFQAADYRVVAGDLRTAAYAIVVDSPPALVAWQMQVTPPAYMRLPEYRLAPDADGKLPRDASVPVGSAVTLGLAASQALSKAVLLQGDTTLATHTLDKASPDAELKTVIPSGGNLTLKLTSDKDLTATLPLPVILAPDLPPVVDFVDVDPRLMAAPDAIVPLAFRASDLFGLTAVRLERVPAEGPPVVIATAPVTGEGTRQFAGRFLLELKDFRLKAPASMRVRLVALDNGPDAETRRGVSRLVEIVVPLAEDRNKLKQDAVASARASLTLLIKTQQEALDDARTLAKRAEAGRFAPATPRQELLAQQTMVRSLATDLLKNGGEALGDLRIKLESLQRLEMAGAVDALDRLTRAADAEQATELGTAVKYQTTILSVLLGLPPAMDFEQDYQRKSDLLSSLQKLIEKQRKNLKATRTGQTEKWAGDPVADLVATQEDIGDDATRFISAGKSASGELAQDDFTQAVAAAVKVLEDGEIYEKSLSAADQLNKVDWPGAIQGEEECLKIMMNALDILNKWRVNKARTSIVAATETLKDVADKLKDLEEKQQRILETTKDLTKRGVLDDDVREQLKKMDEEQKDFKDLLEKMAQDLYQFPELPVANELNSKMREVYEDVEQVIDSEHAPSVEIAVQKEESFLEAIKNTKKRVEDVEMWMPDVPDNIKWDMESFDASEMPEMPLVPLPEELEDIVGDLLDQADDIDQQSQDSTGNNMTADAEMGWGIADGPIPNFSAKGKSGNAKPNDNEMTGRSGAGREGQSNGELAENKVKGLEGRETKARRTNDALQKGQVEEEEGSTLDARATGGGKLGGESENDGMFGDAPRRDLHITQNTNTQGLRQETEAVYTTARLLYLGNTRSLGAASEEMRLMENTGREQKGFDSLQQKVVRRLQDSQTEIGTGAALPMPVNTRATSGGNALHEDLDLKDIGEDYRDIVSDYYKNLGN